MELDLFTVYAVSAAGGLILLVTASLAYIYPRAAVPIGFFLILIADTKFRVRAVTDALAAEVDSQILLELGLYALIATVTAMLLAASRRGRGIWRPLDLLSCGYVLVCIASCAWSLTPKVTMVRSLQVLVLFVFVHASLRVTGSERMFRALTASCTIYVLVCTALALMVPGLGGASPGRFQWFFVHPISAGGFAAIAALSILGIGLYSARGWHDRVLGCPVWLYLLPLITVMLTTKSRGPVLAFIGATGFLLLKRLRSHLATVAVSACLILMCAFIVSIGSFSGYLQQSKTRGELDQVIVSQLLRGQSADQFLAFSGRAELWAGAIQTFYQQPIIGYGYQASRALIVNEVWWGAGHAHNAYLQTLLDVGILGGVFLFSSLILVLFSGFRGRRGGKVRWEVDAISGSVVFLLLNAITDESFAVVGLQLAVAFTCVSVVAQQTLAESQLDWRHTRRVGPNRRGIVRPPALPLQG